MNINKMATSSMLLSCLIMLTSLMSFTAAYGQLAVSDNKTAAQLATALVGPGVSVSSATLNCPGNANGTFTGGGNNLGIGSGILLTSGDASSVANPASVFENTDNSAPGDPSLSALVF